MHVLDIRLLKSYFKLNHQYVEEDIDDIEIKLRLGHKYEENSKELTVILELASEQEKSPFSMEIEFGGKFYIEESDLDHLEQFGTINCPAIIFPYMREHIADLTRRASLRPFHVGPVNFANLKLSDQGKDQDQG